MAMGTSVFRIRIELIFRRCWNLITPLRSAAAALCAAVTQKRGRRAPAPIAPEAQPAKTGGTRPAAGSRASVGYQILNAR
jgi:hypothetical protein